MTEPRAEASLKTTPKANVHAVLDRAIVERVASGDTAVVALKNDALGELLRAHEALGREWGALLERRLTALRKSGKLDYTRKGGWKLPEALAT